MSFEQFSRMELPDLIRCYRDSAISHSDAIGCGNREVANRHSTLIAVMYTEIKHRGRAAQRRLLSLLEDPDLSVRLWAASHTLDIAPTQSEATLTELASGSSLLGLTAETTLREWKAGRLQF